MDFVVYGAEHGIFAPEAGKGEHAGKRQAPDEEGPMGVRHDSPEAAEMAHIDDATHGVHHAASAEKEERLEKGVREEVVHAAGHAGERTNAEGQKHVAELADG